MNEFLMLISDKINTVNNYRNTKDGIITQLQNQKEPLIKKQLLKQNISIDFRANKIKLLPDEDKSILKTTMFKYKLIKIRHKISYIAFSKRMTIQELIIN